MTSQVWFITGASSGLGEAYAREALSRGYSVAAVARSAGALESLVRAAPERVLAHVADLTLPGEAADAVRAAVARFGHIDVLLNNAGAGMLGAVEETSDADLRALFELNFFAPVATVRAALPHMRERGRGTIVNVSSYMGQLSAPGIGAYSATKFALEGLTEALAAELEPFGIRVLLVEPGGFRTNIAGASFRTMPGIDAYRPLLQPLRDVIVDLARQAPGDPARAAAALANLLERPDLPRRIQFGSDSAEVIREHSRALLRDLEKWHHVAASTDFPKVTAETEHA